MTGSDKGSCSDSLDVTVDQSAKIVIVGSGTCSSGLFEDIVLEGELISANEVEGSLEATLAGTVTTTGAWGGVFSGDVFIGDLSGSETSGKDTWSYTGTISLSR